MSRAMHTESGRNLQQCRPGGQNKEQGEAKTAWQSRMMSGNSLALCFGKAGHQRYKTTCAANCLIDIQSCNQSNANSSYHMSTSLGLLCGTCLLGQLHLLTCSKHDKAAVHAHSHLLSFGAAQVAPPRTVILSSGMHASDDPYFVLQCGPACSSACLSR